MFIDPCGNGICEPSIGETCISCYQDCGLCQMAPPNYESLSSFVNSSNTIVAVWENYANLQTGVFYVLQMSHSQDTGFQVVYLL